MITSLRSGSWIDKQKVTGLRLIQERKSLIFEFLAPGKSLSCFLLSNLFFFHAFTWDFGVYESGGYVMG